MQAASHSRVPEGFVVGFLPIKNVPFATSTLGFVEICGVCSSGTGANSSRASTGSYRLTLATPTIADPSIPEFPWSHQSPSSRVTTAGADFEADEVEAADGTIVATSEMSEESEESEESDPDAECPPPKSSAVQSSATCQRRARIATGMWSGSRSSCSVRLRRVKEKRWRTSPARSARWTSASTPRRNGMVMDVYATINVLTASQGDDWKAVWY
jgi:hypothetical protein